jgi:hypothetical protein
MCRWTNRTAKESHMASPKSGLRFAVGFCFAVVIVVIAPSLTSADQPKHADQPQPGQSLVVSDSNGMIIGPATISESSNIMWVQLNGTVFSLAFDGTGFTVSPAGTLPGLYTSSDCSGTALVAVLPVNVVENSLKIIGTTGYFEPRTGGALTVVNSVGVPGNCNVVGPTTQLVVPYGTIDLTAFLAKFTPPFSLALSGPREHADGQ